MQAYCVKCRAKKEMKDAKNITMKNGRPAMYIVSAFGSARNSCEVRQLRELFWLSGGSKVRERKESECRTPSMIKLMITRGR
jgi:hypothetical protein